MEWTNEDDVNCGNLNEDRRIQAMGSNPIVFLGLTSLLAYLRSSYPVRVSSSSGNESLNNMHGKRRMQQLT